LTHFNGAEFATGKIVAPTVLSKTGTVHGMAPGVFTGRSAVPAQTHVKAWPA
jgi:hypothetical protein